MLVHIPDAADCSEILQCDRRKPDYGTLVARPHLAFQVSSLIVIYCVCTVAHRSIL